MVVKIKESFLSRESFCFLYYTAAFFLSARFAGIKALTAVLPSYRSSPKGQKMTKTKNLALSNKQRSTLCIWTSHSVWGKRERSPLAAFLPSFPSPLASLVLKHFIRISLHSYRSDLTNQCGGKVGRHFCKYLNHSDTLIL